MTPLLEIFGFLSVLLRGAILAFQSLVIGGLVFYLVSARVPGFRDAQQGIRRFVRCFTISLAVSETLFILANTAILMQSAEMTLAEAAGANYFVAGSITVAAALLICALARRESLPTVPTLLLMFVIIACSVATSHAASRMDNRLVLAGLTGLHQAATAAWIGGLPFLLISLKRCPDSRTATAVSQRFSRIAMTSVATLAGAGVILALFYVDSIPALYGTAYGVMLMSKVALFGIMLGLGAMNFFIVRRLNQDATSLILRLRRFAELEIGYGFTIILAAASFTSQPPSVDMTVGRVTAAEIVERFTPRPPRFTSPNTDQLSVPSLQTLRLAAATGDQLPESFVPGQAALHPNTPSDIAWSEYNHHWAGFLVLIMGVLALASRTGRAKWTRNWPLVFLGLALFMFLRADPESWPLGANGFWESFADSEVLQHRAFVALIVMFAIFEWKVQRGRIVGKWAPLVFPLVCAAGGAFLMTHSHSLGNVKEELLAEMSHVPLAILGVSAGWARWLELRVVHRTATFAAWVWPVCFILIGLLLLIYRES